jgi:hypothetical protein
MKYRLVSSLFDFLLLSAAMTVCFSIFRPDGSHALISYRWSSSASEAGHDAPHFIFQRTVFHPFEHLHFSGGSHLFSSTSSAFIGVCTACFTSKAPVGRIYPFLTEGGHLHFARLSFIRMGGSLSF